MSADFTPMNADKGKEGCKERIHHAVDRHPAANGHDPLGVHRREIGVHRRFQGFSPASLPTAHA
ncbi:MAG: hypothetical protein NDI88_14310 [Lysobacter sp.]|nr:hypothetical protein [Lysobacter sp.]